MDYKQIIQRLKSLENPENVKGMARYGINPENNLGINVTTLRSIAREIGKNHDIALKLWDSGIHDARMLAAHVDEPKLVTEKQMDSWAMDFNSWDVCDNACGHLFDKISYGYKKAFEWSSREEEFVKRAGFAIMAWAAVHDKKQEDQIFIDFMAVIKRESSDERNYVKKAVNWALRNIGKRNIYMNKIAIKTSEEILKIDTKSARWIGKDAIRDLTSEKIQQRLKKIIQNA